MTVIDSMTVSAPIPLFLILLIIVIAIFDAILKAITLWKSARNKQIAWFICLLIFNTAGILPLIYLIIHRKRRKNSVNA